MVAAMHLPKLYQQLRFSMSMCGRFSITVSANEISQKFKVKVDEFKPNYNVAPTHKVLTILSEQPEQVEFLRWGLIPHWSNDKKVAYKMINARAETLDAKPAYKGLLKRNRCVILADGFYEWKKTENGKVPYRITVKNKKPFAFAGLWDRCKLNNETFNTCTIITCEANEIMRPIHNRMPVILKDHNAWLENANLNLLQPYESEDMITYKVNSSVGNVRNNSKDLLLPV